MVILSTVGCKVVLGIAVTAGLMAAQSSPSSLAATATTDWPRELRSGNVVFSVHQPQIESWDGYRTKAYAAVTAKLTGQDNPSYGVLRFSAQTSVQRPQRLVYFDDYRVDDVSFPASQERATELKKALSSTTSVKSISLDHFEAALAAAEAQRNAQALPLKNDPPSIVFQVVPSILVYVDGTPSYQAIPKSSWQRVINTRSLLVKDDAGNHFVHLFDGWMATTSLDGSWVLATKRPKELDKILAEARKNPQVDLLEGQPSEETQQKPKLEKGKIPIIVVATKPTELIISEGEWSWEPVTGTNLEYVRNTTGHVFRNRSDSKIYVLISGRWFTASDRQGPWAFVSGGKLPADFRNIPDDSPKENIKASVPDTPQAEEAVIANMIPQTATVKRAEAKLTTPKFDGAPQLKPIDGTSLEQVINSPTPIIKSQSTFYAVENGVWFTAKAVTGPWTIADSVPPEIYKIPPSSSLHYVTYVRIYNSTPDTVTVGYTPGYMGSVTTSGSGFVVVFGTGYYYPPWIGAYWFGPPVTYGFGTSITYTPWTGWAFGYGFGWSWGYSAVTVGWGWGYSPWWGPVGWGAYYRPVYAGGVAWGRYGAAAWGPWGGWAGTTGNIYGRWGNTAFVGRQSGGYNPWTGNRWASRVGSSYNSRTGTLSAGQRAAVGNAYTGSYAYGNRGAATNARLGVSATGGRATVGNVYSGDSATVAGGRITNDRTGNSVRAGGIRTDQGTIGHVGDNVFATHDGNVYRHSGDSWQQFNRNQWNQTRDAARISGLDRERSARMQGSYRSQSFQNRSYGAAGARGGARGRRR